MNNHSKKKLDKFLEKNKRKKENNDPYTHLRIGDPTFNVYGGSYYIKNEKDLREFYKLYHSKVFDNKQKEYMAEKQNKESGGPILIDLDFRYDMKKIVRQHGKHFIKDLLKLYLKGLKNLFNFKNEYVKIEVFVFERDNVYTDTAKNVIKDGIHIVIGLHCDHTIQTMLRETVMKTSRELFATLPLKNDIDDVFDAGISKGITPWQLYGSIKPGRKPYELKYIYNFEFNYNNKKMKIKKEKESFVDKKKGTMEILTKSSALYTEYPKFEILDKIKDEYNEMKQQKKKKKKVSQNNIVKNIMKNQPQSRDDLIILAKAAIEERINKSAKYSFLRDIHEYTMILSEKYYNPYNEWLQVGWALYNTSPCLFWTWMAFSAKSDKFDYSEIEKHSKMWYSNNNIEQGLTYKSIEYWCRTESPNQYEEIKKNGVSILLENTLSSFEYLMRGVKGFGGKKEVSDEGLDTDMAYLTYHIYRGKYVCVNMTKNIWYKFENHKWVENNQGVDLQEALSNDIHSLYIDQITKLKSEFCSIADDGDDEKMKSEHKRISKRILLSTKVSVKLRSRKNKKNILHECAVVFFDPEMMERLNENPNLLGFTNGVYDLKKMEFRDGLPEDYISLSTKWDYVPFDISDSYHKECKEEIDDFMEKLFPDDELRKYMWEHAASTLSGLNLNQKFNIYTGGGANGKSKFVNLLSKALGTYADTLDIGVVTHKKSGPGRPMPEITKLPGKRYICMDESTKGDVLNEGIIKQFTGGDRVEARGMYGIKMTQFIPQFEFVHTTNNLPEIKSRDHGTWRRLRQVPFKTKFVDPNEVPVNNIDPHSGNKVYVKDMTIEEKIEKWAPIFISMLIEIFKKTKGKVYDCDIVMDATNKYRYKQDILGNFICEMLENTGEPTDILKKKDVYKEFVEWYELDHNDKPPKSRDLYDAITEKIGESRFNNKHWSGVKIKSTYDEDSDSDDEMYG